MAYLKEQHVCNKFCTKLQAEAFKMLEVVFGNQKMGRAKVLEQFSMLKISANYVEDSERVRRPLTCKT